MRILCTECFQPISSEVPDNTIIRGYTLCPECLELIPEGIADAFLELAEMHGKRRARKRQEGLLKIFTQLEQK